MNLVDGIGITSVEDRYFVALLPAHTKPNLLEAITPHVDWIGFNLFDIRGSKFYSIAKRRGIRDTFGIDDDKRVFLTSTQKDEKLWRFYSESNGIEKFKSDIIDFDVDIAMGPDWFIYDDDALSERRKNIKKAIELNLECIDLENIAPDIHGTNVHEMRDFIEPFKSQGKEIFVMPGREYLINIGDRKKSQRRLAALTSIIARSEKVKIIVTGCSSPKLQESLPDVLAFVGLGWLIQARYRRLILNKTYRSIFDRKFFCNDFDCCGSFSRKELARTDNDHVRAIHNLKKIKFHMMERPRFSQLYLVN